MVMTPSMRRLTLPVRSQWWRFRMWRGKCVTHVHLYPGFKGSEVPPRGTRCECGKTQWGVAP